MKEIHSFKADDREPLALIFDRDIPNWSASSTERQRHKMWAEEAHKVANYKYKHLPGALIDHLFVEFAMRAASLYVIPHREDVDEADACALAEALALLGTPRCDTCGHSELFHDAVLGTSKCRIPACTCHRVESSA